jgi:hypothetical protein
MDVTQQILHNHIIYGASDYTAPHGLASGKKLNYAEGATITKPSMQSCSVVPFTFKYEDTVGLFGAENHFIKIKLNVVGDQVNACFEEVDWECAVIKEQDSEEPYWQMGIVDDRPELDPVYVSANINLDALPTLINGYLSVDLNNLKINNRYIDDWLDVRLYTKDREEHPYEKMYVRLRDFFYIGFHARNTRRLSYNVECVVGLEYLEYESIPDKRFIMRTIS